MLLSTNYIWNWIVRTYSHQMKAGVKAKMIKGHAKKDQRIATNIKENFGFCFRFYSVWMGLKAAFYKGSLAIEKRWPFRCDDSATKST